MKIKKFLLSSILIFVITVLSACGVNTTTTTGYTYKDSWSFNDEYHFHESITDSSVIIDKALHSFSEWSISVEPTETTSGAKNRTCTVCGYTQTETLDPIEHVHTFSSVWSYDETYHYHNSTCGHDVRGSESFHKFSEWRVTKYSTEEETGTKERVCSVCGFKEIEEIPKLSHSHTFKTEWSSDDNYHYHESNCGHDVVSAKSLHSFSDEEEIVGEDGFIYYKKVCSICGYISLTKHNHTFESKWSYDKDYHYHNSTCGHDAINSKEAHTYSSWIITKEATEEEAGSKYRSCNVCGYKEVETIEKITHVHTFESDWSSDSEYHYHTSTCGHDVVDSKEAHDFTDWVIKKNPTTLEEGLKIRICKVCRHEESEKIEKLHSHTFSDEWSSDKDYHWHQSTCGHDEKSEFAPHDFSDWIVTTEPGEDTEGLKERTCSICGYKEEEIIAALSHTHTFESSWSSDSTYHYHGSLCGHNVVDSKAEHTFGEWIITTDATCANEGSKERVCSVCGYKEVVTLAKLPHAHEETLSYDELGHYFKTTCEHEDIKVDYELHDFSITQVLNPTCTTKGYTTHTCSVCGYSYNDTETNELGHDVSASFNWSEDYLTVTITLTCTREDIVLKEETLSSAESVITDATCENKGSLRFDISYSYLGVLYSDYKIKETAALGHNYVFDHFDWSDDLSSAVPVYVCTHNDTHIDEKSSVPSVSNITVDPTCDNKGTIEYIVTYQNNTDTKTKDIAELGHSYSDEWNYDSEKHYHICIRCGSSKSSEANHTFGNYVVTKEATETEAGSKYRDCSVCGYRETVSIPKLENQDTYELYDEIYSGNYYASITENLLYDADALIEALTQLVNNSYTRFSYSQAHDRLKIVDSYDLDYVECIYTGMRIEKSNSGSNTGSWNKEHIWAKDYGFGDEKYDAYSDMHHLRVSEANINSSRSNSYFAELNSYTSSDNYGNVWTNNIFEPRDEVKGDIARMLFYMVIRYNDITDTNGNNLNLELTDDVSLITSSNNKSNKNYGGTHYLGLLSSLIKWHYEDPVDEREIFRNEKIYGYQGNRNPFIDHPELVYYIYTSESSAYITLATLSEVQNYTKKDTSAISALEAKIASIGTVTLDSGDLINECLSDYNALSNVSKSFMTKYRLLNDSLTEYERLLSEENQDTNVSTEISFIGVSTKTGTITSNGISVDFNAPNNNAKFGVYSGRNKNNGSQNPLTLVASNLYDSIVSISVYADNNNYNGTFSVTVTDKNGKTVTNTNFTTKKASSSLAGTINISSLDLSGNITIVITDTTDTSSGTASSTRVSKIVFNVN